MNPKEFRAEFNNRLPTILKLDPVVSIDLMGNTYQLELDNRAVKNVLLDVGVNLLGEGIRGSQLQDPAVISSILHRAMNRHHPDITADQVDGMMQFRKFIYIRDRVITCLELFVPDMSDVSRSDEDEQNP